MLENITNKITGIFQGLSNKGAITEKDLETTLREVRVALLEADVSLKVSKDLIKKIQEKALGQKVIENVQPGQQIIKIVSDELTEILGVQSSELNFKNKPSTFLMCGLQGAGKTTSIAKLAHYCQNSLNKSVALVSTDLRRPAAIDQLRILSQKNNIQFIEPINENIKDIVNNALEQSKKLLSDVLIIDTSGRISTDDILTRLDADPRGGVALSAKYQTGLPIRFFGSGENIEDFEVFHPERIASRILGMGDVVSLVEKAQKDFDQKEMENLQSQMMSGKFNMNDLLKQFTQMKKMGGMSGLMSHMPGVSKIKNMMESGDFDEKVIDHQIAIICSMTREERVDPDLLKASRKRRIATGSGRQVHEVNRLLKQFEQTKKLMKQAQKPGFANKIKSLLGGNQMPTIE